MNRSAELRLLRAHPRRTAAVVALMALAGAAEGFGLLTLLPALQAILPAAGPPTRASRAVTSALQALGLRPTLPTLFATILAALVAKAIFRWLAMAQAGAAVADVAAELRLRLVRALFAARWSHFVAEPAGGAASAVSRDAFWAAFAYRDACAALAALAQLVAYAAALVLVSWRLGLLALAAGALATLPLGAWVRVSRRAGAAQTRHAGALVTRLLDALRAMKPIKAMARERAFVAALAAETEALRDAERRHVRATEGLRALQEPLLAAVVLAVLFAAVARGGADPATVLLVALLFQRMVGRVQSVQVEYQAMVGATSAHAAIKARIAAAEREREGMAGSRLIRRGVGAAAPAPRDESGTAEPRLEREIEVDGVWYSHAGRPVLRGASLCVPAGSFVAVLGPSGAGKSTLLDLIAALRTPDAGEVRVDGVPLGEASHAEWRRRIGYVPQDATLLHDTILANVALGDPSIGVAEATRALEQAGAAPLLATLPAGLATVAGEGGGRLSGGERRRIALARALAGRPRLLLLDEATAELDPDSAAAIGRTLRSLRGPHTILAVTHHPALADAADAAYVLEDGVLTALAGVGA